MNHKFYVIIVVAAIICLQGCSKQTRDKWLAGRYDVFQPQYEGRTDSIAGIEAREALDSLSFYMRRATIYKDFRKYHEEYYRASHCYDIFVHNGEVISHDCDGNDYIGKVIGVKVERPTEGKYDYKVILYTKGKKKFTQDIFGWDIYIYMLRNSDKAFYKNGSESGRVEPLIGEPERYRPSYFHQQLNPGKTLIIDGDTVKVR